MLRALHLRTAFRKALVAVVALALITIATLTNDVADAASGSAGGARTQTSEAVATTCPGTPAADAFIEGCGLYLDGSRVLTWDRPSIALDDALSPARLVFVGLPKQSEASPTQAVSVWQRDDRGIWHAWGTGIATSTPRLERFEAGGTYMVVSSTPVAWSLPPVIVVAPSIFATGQVLSYYGFPGVPTMGILGEFDAKEVMRQAAAQAAVYDALNGQQTVTPALHLITTVAQADSGWDGTYLGRLSLDTVHAYAEVAAAAGGVLILDIQIGWSDPLTEVRGYEAALRLPNVHVALDPEFATWRKGEPPGGAIGSVTGDEVNAVQRYLADLVRTHGLPPKALVVHQFRDDMILEPERIAPFPGVDLVIDMDGWGYPDAKLSGYERYALASYAPLAGLKLFYRWDEPVMTPATLLGLERPPKLIIYQ